MLSLEHRVSAHRGLMAVSNRIGRRQPLTDKIGGMSPQLLHTYAPDIRRIFRRKTKTTAK